jgi:predicted component of type VI protein secretion system
VEVQASAILVRISDAEQSKTLPPIPITADELTFGRDPTLVTQILEDPSVEAIHARLRLGADNAYRLYDEGSTAGTWVNYTPISPEGSRLEHGDLIHIGRVGFRFSLREAVNIRKPTITKKEFH